jgi:hypothetical protein
MLHYTQQTHRFLHHNHRFQHQYHLKALNEPFHSEETFNFYQSMLKYCFRGISLQLLVINFEYEFNFSIFNNYLTKFISGLVFKEEYCQQRAF